MPIPIENIYYLLCYAWDKLEEKEQVRVSTEDLTSLLDLMAKVLIKGCQRLLKRGIEKNYFTETVELAGIKGKLEMSPTVRKGLHLKQRTICTIDEFSDNILTNQILISTIDRLMRIRDLDASIKKELKSFHWMLPGIDVVPLSGRVFKQVRLHRNNHFYDFLLKVCYLIYENTLPSEKPGEWLFMDFQRDPARMNRLYEAFLFNFYRREFPDWQVRREYIKWQLIAADPLASKYLPRMETDITIDTGFSKTILDAKYYSQTLASSYDSFKVHSANLYQLFSYLINQRSSSKATMYTRGILLYPTIDRELNLDYWYENHRIQIKTVNLHCGWQEIDKRLRSIVED
jgi:5-methylcytosine-specific restriction enzyme subunit McrC